VFYLKFVRRNGSLANGSIITLIDHYERLLQDPSCKGPHGAMNACCRTHPAKDRTGHFGSATTHSVAATSVRARFSISFNRVI